MSAASKDVNSLLKDVFAAKHADAAVRHFKGCVEDFELTNWDDASAKGGKFIEAVIKALWDYAKEAVPAGRHFSVGKLITQLENKTTVPDTIRLTIPRSCRFAYEIASNRGARHDPDEIEANEMDARTVLANCAWILAEMVRFSQKGHDVEMAKVVVDGLMKRRYPFAESVDGRVYADVGKSALDVALVILYYIYPKRISREDLIEAVVRHPFKRSNATTAVSRVRRFIDDDGAGSLRLRNAGLIKTEEILAKRRK